MCRRSTHSLSRLFAREIAVLRGRRPGDAAAADGSAAEQAQAALRRARRACSGGASPSVFFLFGPKNWCMLPIDRNTKGGNSSRCPIDQFAQS
jgi:hypothetical protein